MATQFRQPKQLIFILGLQRSGTTWLANIFDAHPTTSLFMEPFAPNYGIIPEFPETSYFLQNSSPFLEQLLTHELLPRLFSKKKLLFANAMSEPKLFRLERWLVNKIQYAKFVTPRRVSNRIRQYQLLNLNRFDDGYPLYAKNNQPAAWVIKELRLAGKLPVLLQSFPEAKFIVIIRHPCATVHSILQWFTRGGLSELRQEIDTFVEKIEAQKIAERYQKQIHHCKTGTLTDKIALYWRISYESMFQQLAGLNNVHLITYEQLALDAKETVHELFNFASIPWALSLSEYLDYSTSSTAKNPSAITTIRDSTNYYRSWVDKISPDTQAKVMEIVGDSFLMPQFETFYGSNDLTQTTVGQGS